ncbi:MAG: ATP-binding protein DrrA1-3 family domain-containing protein [Planctomycetota bacterium]
MTLTAAGDAAVAWPETLSSLEGVSAFAAEGGKATATVNAGGQVLPRLLEATHTAGIEIAEVEMLRPSLDAVFLHHTGRRLADEAGGDGGGA